MFFFFTNTIKIPEVLKKINKVFKKNGFECYLVGGAVRDFLMKKKPADWDLTTNATPKQVMSMFKKVIPTGIAHGTVTVHYMEKQIEVTTFRTESQYSDGRHPDNVEFTGNIKDDLSRRDFTMNAIAVSLDSGKLVDPFHGKKDILKKTIRTVGNPKERFLEDGLRPIRALRFAAQLGFKIEKNTYNCLFDSQVKEKVSGISVERFRDELMKLLKAPRPSDGLKIMEESGILDIFMPELKTCRGCIQKDDRGYHVFDVMSHCFYACDGAPREKPFLRLAALFHDIGKPDVRKERVENGLKIINFYNHEKKSTEKTQILMTRLKFSNAEIKYVCHLIENHMFHYESSWSDSAVRRFIVRVGSEYIDDLIDLRLADMYGKYNKPVRIHDNPACLLLNELKNRIEKVEKDSSVLTMKNLAVDGNALIKAGIPAGKDLGRILKELFDLVLEDPSMNTEEKLTECALKMYQDTKSV